MVGDGGEDEHVGQVTQKVEEESGGEQFPLCLQQFVQRLQDYHPVPELGRAGESQRHVQFSKYSWGHQGRGRGQGAPNDPSPPSQLQSDQS